jgi:hypothetical protein
MPRRRELLQAASVLTVGTALPATAAAQPQREWALAPFKAVQARVPIRVVLAPASQSRVAARAEAKVLAQLRAEVRGGVLHLESSGNWQTREPAAFEIGFGALESLVAAGGSDVVLQRAQGAAFELKCGDTAEVDAQALDIQALRVAAAGSATVRLAGRCQRLSLEAAGSGDVFASTLSAQEARVRAGGSSTVEIAAAASLDATVVDAATVRYKGRPRITQKVDGAGTLEALA